MSFAVSIQDPIKQAIANIIGMIVKGSPLKASLNPETLLESDWRRERFVIYFENKLTKAKGIKTGIPQQ